MKSYKIEPLEKVKKQDKEGYIVKIDKNPKDFKNMQGFLIDVGIELHERYGLSSVVVAGKKSILIENNMEMNPELFKEVIVEVVENELKTTTWNLEE